MVFSFYNGYLGNIWLLACTHFWLVLFIFKTLEITHPCLFTLANSAFESSVKKKKI